MPLPASSLEFGINTRIGGKAVKMDLLENGCLKILLTEDELRDFNLTFGALDYNNENTRSALHQLLEKAKRQTGFDASGSFIIEALPVDGGCMLLLTPTCDNRRVRMKRWPGPTYTGGRRRFGAAFAESVGSTPPRCTAVRSTGLTRGTGWFYIPARRFRGDGQSSESLPAPPAKGTRPPRTLPSTGVDCGRDALNRLYEAVSRNKSSRTERQPT